MKVVIFLVAFLLLGCNNETYDDKLKACRNKGGSLVRDYSDVGYVCVKKLEPL